MANTTTTEYAVVELVDGEWIFAGGAQTWYSDMYYLDDLTGAEAAQAGLARIAAAVPGTYRVAVVREFERPEPRFHLTVIMRGDRPFNEPYRNLTAAEVEHVKATASRMAVEDGHTVAFAQVRV